MAPPTSPLKILEGSRVRPLSNSSASVAQLTLPLTFFDVLCLNFQPTERVFFYRVAGLTRSYFDSVIVPGLKSSLSGALSHYLPLSGLVLWEPKEPKPCICYSLNDSVLVTTTESEADFHGVSSDEPRPAAELRLLVPELSCSDNSSSIIAIQITLFPNEGFCIGTTAHHAVLDGKTTAMFIKAWAHICKQKRGRNDLVSLPPDLIPFLDRTVIKDPTGLDMKILNACRALTKQDQSNSKSLKIRPKEASSDVVRATFELTRANIEKLKERVKNESPQELSSKELHLSTFVITYAYVFTCMVRTRGGGTNRRVFFGLSADYRTRLDPPVPTTYFGNCIVPTAMDVDAGVFMEKNGFVSAVKMISGMVTGLNSETIEKMHELIQKFWRIEPGTQTVVVSGSNRLGLYGSDFGWGRPVKAEIVTIDRTGAISLAESRDGSGGGVEIGLCLKRDEMNVFVSLFADGLKN